VNDESMTLAQVRARLEEADLMEREIAALKDRVRSLQDSKCALCGEELHAAFDRIADLQSQLAWTPVSAGLPTVSSETRAVLIVQDGAGGAMLLEPRYYEDGEWKWCCAEFPFGIKFATSCTWSFRRIELPEAP